MSGGGVSGLKEASSLLRRGQLVVRLVKRSSRIVVVGLKSSLGELATARRERSSTLVAAMGKRDLTRTLFVVGVGEGNMQLVAMLVVGWELLGMVVVDVVGIEVVVAELVDIVTDGDVLIVLSRKTTC
jgi:hypothetical protein